MSESSKSETPPPNKLPGRFVEFQKRYPDVFKAYESLGAATQTAGPLDDPTKALVKLAIAVGARMEGAVHSHTRRAVEAGCTREEIRQVAVLSTTTMGFPAMMAALSWIDDILQQG